MKQNNLSFRKVAAIISIVSAAAILHSCGREKDILPSPSYSIANNFVGSFEGWNSCGTDTAYFRINAGANRSMALIPSYFGMGGCQITPNVNATVKGDSIHIPFAEFQDHCFGDYTIKGEGIYKNDSLFIEIMRDSPIGKDTCRFWGRKLADTSDNIQK